MLFNDFYLKSLIIKPEKFQKKLSKRQTFNFQRDTLYLQKIN